MARTYRSRHLRVMRDTEQAMDMLFARLVQDVTREIMMRADAEGMISQDEQYALEQAVDQRIMRMFLARRGQRMVPFTVARNGEVIPASPYMDRLWNGIQRATRIPAEHHASVLRRYLPRRLVLRLDLATERPVREQTDIFRPHPLAQYDPPHLWVDPNGYQLSERVWRTASNTRRRVDMLLEEGIREGRAARDIAADAERFLQPGRTLRTRKPYGTDASFDAMRLARTEVSRAAAEADEMSAAMNPFVEGLEWNRSPGSDYDCDECEDLAAGGPYPVDDPPVMPAHPHCMCYWSYALVEDKQEVIRALQEDARRARSELMDRIGPLQTARFTQMLLRGWQVARPEAA